MKTSCKTRNGLVSRVLTTNANMSNGHTIVYIVVNESGFEGVFTCFSDGKILKESASGYDLVL